MSNSGKRPDWVPEGFGWFGPESDPADTISGSLAEVAQELEVLAGIMERWTDIPHKQRGASAAYVAASIRRMLPVINNVHDAHLEVELRAQRLEGGA